MLTSLLPWSFAIYWTVVHGFGINLIKVTEDDHSQVFCSIALLRKYFHSGETLSGSVISMSITSASARVQQNLLKAIHSDVEAWSVLVKNARQEVPPVAPSQIMHEKPQCYFLVLENLEDEDLEDIFEDWKTNVNWNPLAQFVVYLASVEETDDEMTELMIEILLNFMNKKIYNVNVIGQNEENGFYYGKTVFPYHPDNNCGNRVITIETLDICDYQEIDRDEDEEDYNGTIEEDNYLDDPQTELSAEEDRNDTVTVRGESDNGEDDQGSDEGGDDGGDEGPDDGGDEVADEGADEGNDEGGDEGPDDGGYEVADEGRDEGGDERDNDGGDVGVAEGNDEGGNEGGDERGNDGGDDGVTEAGIEEFKDGGYEGVDEGGDDPGEGRGDDPCEGRGDEPGGKGNDEGGIEEGAEDNGEESSKHSGKKDGNVGEDYAEDGVEEGIGNGADFSGDSDNHGYIDTPDAVDENAESNSQSAETQYHDDYPNVGSKHTTKLRAKPQKYIEYSNSTQPTKNPNATSGKFYLEELFPALFLDKFPKDLSGCPLIAAYRPWEPYIFSEVTEEQDYEAGSTASNDVAGSGLDEEDDEYGDYNGTDVGENYDVEDSAPQIKLSGIEYKMVQTIGEHLHISIDLQVENNNLYHLFQLLIDGDIEMVVGGIDEDPSISQFVSSTIPYHQDDLTWCVAKAKRNHNLFNFLASFRVGVWLLIFLFIVVTTLNVVVIKRLLHVRLWHLQGYFIICLRVMGIMLNQSMRLKRVPTALRMTLGAAFFMGFIFSNVYQSFLVSTLTTPKSFSQISHLHEIYRHRMTIMGSVENVRHLNKEGEIFKYIREKFQMCYNIEECLSRAANDEHLAVAVSRQHSFYNPRIPRDRLYCFDRDENMYVYLVTMLLPKKFHLLHKINPVIQHIIESGHMQKWARDLDMKRKLQEEIRLAREAQFKSLNLAEVIGTFAFSALLIWHALWIFWLECWVYWMAVRRKTRLKIVKSLHRRFKQF